MDSAFSSERKYLDNLPPELLGVVFEECSVVDPDIPSTLSLVSRKFRSVLRSTPQAWTRLRLQAREGDDARSSHKVELWFSMVATCPVDVTVHVIPSSTPQSGFFLKDVTPPSYGVGESLKLYTNCIGSLSVEASSECDGRAFMNAVYHEASSIDTFALQSLDIKISSTVPPTPFASSIPLPHLPNLRHLILLNHSIAFLASRRFDQLQTLSVTRPIRFVPFSLATLLGILRNAPYLRVLSVESRIKDDTAGDNSLIQLPFVTSVFLRTNVIPSIISCLLLPNLSHLHIDDLNGKHPNRSKETAIAFRQLLVRMEMPSEHRFGNGIKYLDMTNVQVSTATSPGTSDDSEAVWEWCFARMKNLEELSARKVDCTPVIEILGSPCWASTRSSGPPIPGDFSVADPSFPCPSLTRIVVTDPSLSHIDWFTSRRPEVLVWEVEGQKDLFSPISPTPIDYLRLYTDRPTTPVP